MEEKIEGIGETMTGANVSVHGIVGQEDFIAATDNIFKIFSGSQGEIRPHFTVVGNSGSGKSYTIQRLCEHYDLHFIDVNAAQITKEGTAGNSLSKALGSLRNHQDQPVVVFVDEFDKLFISGNSNTSLANEVTVGVQNELLKILESPTTQVFGDYGRYDTVSVERVLFIFAGAFNGAQDVTVDDLRDFGVKTEFLGRVGLVYNTQKLSLEALKEILNMSDLLTKYCELYEGVEREDVVQAIEEHLESIYDNNTLGARIINTLVHQYFVNDGKLAADVVKKSSFSKALKLNEDTGRSVTVKEGRLSFQKNL